MNDQHIIKKNSDLIWAIANLLRRPYRPPQYRRVMIPHTALRRLDCVLGNTKADVMKMDEGLKSIHTQKSKGGKTCYDEQAMEKIINRKFGLSFYNTSGFTFASREAGVFAMLKDDPSNLTQFIAGFSPKARKILEKFKFEEEIEILDDANRLCQIVDELANVDLYPNTVSNIAMGYLFEDLFRRFNGQANEEAGDHFTPRETSNLMVHILYTDQEAIYNQGRHFPFMISLAELESFCPFPRLISDR